MSVIKLIRMTPLCLIVTTTWVQAETTTKYYRQPPKHVFERLNIFKAFDTREVIKIEQSVVFFMNG